MGLLILFIVLFSLWALYEGFKYEKDRETRGYRAYSCPKCNTRWMSTVKTENGVTTKTWKCPNCGFVKTWTEGA